MKILLMIVLLTSFYSFEVKADDYNYEAEIDSDNYIYDIDEDAERLAKSGGLLSIKGGFWGHGYFVGEERSSYDVVCKILENTPNALWNLQESIEYLWIYMSIGYTSAIILGVSIGNLIVEGDVNYYTLGGSGLVYIICVSLYGSAIENAQAALNLYNNNIHTTKDQSSLLNQTINEHNKYTSNVSLNFGATPQGIGFTLRF
jgi:hypothetical protein